MKQSCGWMLVAVALLGPALALGAGDIVLEGITATDAFPQNGDVHVRFTTSAPTSVPDGVCDVTLVKVLSSSTVVLKANCGTPITSINWLRNGVTVKGDVNMVPNATGDVFLVTGTSYSNTSNIFASCGTPSNTPCVYTAVGNRGAIPAGASAVVQSF